MLAQLRLTPEKDMLAHGAFTTEKPRNHPCATGGRAGTVGLSSTTTEPYVHGGDKGRALAACNKTGALCNAE